MLKIAIINKSQTKPEVSWIYHQSEINTQDLVTIVGLSRSDFASRIIWRQHRIGANDDFFTITMQNEVIAMSKILGRRVQ